MIKKSRKEYQRMWRKKNPDKAKVSARRAYLKYGRSERGKQVAKEYRAKWKVKERVVKYMKEYQREYRRKIDVRFKIYMKEAKYKSRIFSLSFEEFSNIINQKCSYCGLFSEMMGIDRMDNEIGYIKDNSVSCCKICNRMKSVLPKDIFIEQCKRIAANGEMKVVVNNQKV